MKYRAKWYVAHYVDLNYHDRWSTKFMWDGYRRQRDFDTKEELVHFVKQGQELYGIEVFECVELVEVSRYEEKKMECSK